MAQRQLPLSKEQFDRIIRENLEEAVGAQQFGYRIDNGRIYENYYTKAAFQDFLQKMPEKVRIAYAGGKGGELEEKNQQPPKMASAASSSRFCWLAFQGTPGVRFEYGCPIRGVKGTPPQLDAWIEAENRFVEVKCHEIFDSHGICMSLAYRDWLEDGFGVTQYREEGRKLILELTQFGLSGDSSMFDIGQLLHHLMGIASRDKRGATLQYLFFKPVAAEEQGEVVEKLFRQMQEEISRIFGSDPIRAFCRKYAITLEAIAEEERIMSPLPASRIIQLYP